MPSGDAVAGVKSLSINGTGTTQRLGNPDTILVLDLDETLLHTRTSGEESVFESIKESKKTASANGDRMFQIRYNHVDKAGAVSSHKIDSILRPGIDEFIDFVTTPGMFAQVVVWTAAEKTYAESAVEQIFADKPLLWSRENCIPHGEVRSKPLMLLANHLKCDPRRILIIDDADYSVAHNQHHGIQVPAYNPVTGADAEDRVLFQLIDFFKSPHFTMYRYSQECDRAGLAWLK